MGRPSGVGRREGGEGLATRHCETHHSSIPPPPPPPLPLCISTHPPGPHSIIQGKRIPLPRQYLPFLTPAAHSAHSSPLPLVPHFHLSSRPHSTPPPPRRQFDSPLLHFIYLFLPCPFPIHYFPYTFGLPFLSPTLCFIPHFYLRHSIFQSHSHLLHPRLSLLTPPSLPSHSPLKYPILHSCFPHSPI